MVICSKAVSFQFHILLDCRLGSVIGIILL